jgi:hypothetical protein
MLKRLLVKTSAKADEDCYGPDYALVELMEEHRSLLTDAMAATAELAARFSSDATTVRTGPLFAAEWWLFAIPLQVTWLTYDALTLDDGSEPDWLTEVESQGFLVPPGVWTPRLGEETDHGHEHEYAEVDCETVRMYPDGKLRIEANLRDSALEFATYEFPASPFDDTSCDPQEATP